MNIAIILFISAIIAVINIAYMLNFLTNNIYRISLFWFGCLPIRLCMTYFAYSTPNSGLFALATGGIGIGLLRAYMLDEPKKQRGETLTSGGFGFANGTAYWHDRRLIHSMLYLLFTGLYLLDIPCSWIVLLADTLIGGLTSVQHYLL